MKFCKDCAHRIQQGQYDMCLHPGARRNAVSGDAFCDFERTYGHPCGLDASLFEPKPVKVIWFKRLFGKRG